ncbi:hypothetical protein ACHAWO_009372 [Cyclotella atomus]|uniref:Replication protein A C-terminal domain-containing protein n=1 Tax=Cyclotella atomus TaxID=382360 RepID=A0ABD3N3G6_9STRA
MSYGGGGFDDNAGGFGSQQTPSKPRRDYDAQTLIPVTVKMLQDAQGIPGGDSNAGDMILADERPLHMVKLVGAVRTVEPKSTNIYLDIEDGTGLFNVKVYNGGQEEGNGGDPSAIQQIKAAAFQDNQYVRIIGQVKEFDGNRTLIANDIRVLASGDEFTYHFCEVAYSYEKYLKRKSQQQQMFGGGMMGYGIGNMASSGAPPPQGGNIISPSNGGGNNTVNQAVITLLQNEGANNDTGIHISEIQQILSGQGFNANDVQKAIADLSNEGHIYSTIDENHYQYAS